MLDVEGVAIVGEHGLELAPDAARVGRGGRRVRRGVDWPAERKPLSLSFHFRRADDEAAARAYLTRVADGGRGGGARPAVGPDGARGAPPVEADKGTAVRALVARAASTGRSTPGTTRRTSTPSAASTGSSVAVRVAVDSRRGAAGAARRRRPRRRRHGGRAGAPPAALETRHASRRSTSHACRTSSSVVRALPIASRRTKRSPRRVCERKASPVAFTRSSSASLSSSEPSRRKQTSEKWRGRADLPARLRLHPALEQRGEPEVLADHGLEPFPAVAAEHGPQLERAEPPAERHRVLAQADDVLVDAEVLGNEAERVPQGVRAAA